MRKFYTVCVAILITSFGLRAQTYGNEWIDFSQRYYTIKVVQDGIYRIDSATLSNAGISLAGLDPRNFQLFGRQQQQAIYVNGETDGVFNTGDYIEFLGFKNDGWLDSLLYENGADDMNDLYYSLYNDTATYYLTYNTSLSNLRAAPFNDTTYSAYVPEPFYTSTSFIKYTSEYYVGPELEGASQSRFVKGEGWVNDRIQGAHSSSPPPVLVTDFDSNVPTPLVYTGAGAPNATITAVAVSSSNASPPGFPPLNHHLRISYGPAFTVFSDTSFYGYQQIKKTTTVPPATLGSPSTTVVRYSIVDDLSVPSDFMNVASTTIRYPRQTNFNGSATGVFTTNYNALEPRTRFDIVNYAGATPLVYMVGDSVWRTNGSLAGSTLKLLVPNTTAGKAVKCHVFNTTINVTQLRPINGTGLFTDYGSMMVDSAYVILTHPKLDSAAQVYAAYRASTAGGSYNTVVIKINELYHQFSAGINKHSIAAQRFCDYIIHTWPGKPKNLFIIGKSIREATEGFYSGQSKGTRKDVSRYADGLVPSFGYPCSDNRITAGLDGSNWEPAIPTGRIAATSKEAVINYLEKVKQYEMAQQSNFYTKPEKDWMKHILSFGGGSNASQQSEFKSYLLNYHHTLEDTLYGGTGTAYFKTSSEPIDPVDFQEVTDRVDNGVSLMIFFGHASIGGFDQNIDDVNNWQNNGKYPFLIANACYSGDIHQPGALSVSEEFTLIPDRGVIGFLSAVKQGFVFQLNQYSDTLTKMISRHMYHKTIGEQIQQSVKGIQNLVVTTDPINIIPPEEVYTGMTLHGDPALHLNPHGKPELVIEPSDAFITPAEITLADDSMDVNLVITNLGKGTHKPFTAMLKRTFPNGFGDSLYFKTVNGALYKDTITFRIPVYHTIAFGTNQFEMTIDLENPSIEEQYDDLNNNRIVFEKTISGNSIFPIYPYNYAIVPDSVIEVKASTVDPFESSKAYRFELDTTDLFSSPFKRYLIVNSTGGVVGVPHTDWLLQSTNMPAPLVHTDSMAYFWRVSPDSSTFIWQEHTYQYIKGKEGWGQSHFFQFKNNRHTHLGYDRPTREWTYESLNSVVKVNVIGFPLPGETGQNGWFLNGQNMEYDGILSVPTFNEGIIYVAVIDPFDPDPWHTFEGTEDCASMALATNIRNYGQFNCRPITGMGRCRGEKYFGFRQSQQSDLDSLYDMITNDIPCGHYFMIYTFGAANFSQWDAHNPNMYTLFQNLGVTGLAPGMANRPLIVMGRKCDTTTTKFVMGPTTHTGLLLTLSDTIDGTLPGIMESVKIGPAQNWNTLYYKQHTRDMPLTGDSTVLYLFGITPTGAQVKIFDTVFSTYDSIINLNGLVPAAQYPYLKLRALTVDNVTHTPVHFDRWQILYETVPEAALNPRDGYLMSLKVDSIEEGDAFRFAIAIKNISDKDMDSLLVHYWVEDASRVKHYIDYARQDSLKSGEILYDTIEVPTLHYPGRNYLWVEANPVPLMSTNHQYDQLEQYHFNNIGRIPFDVSADDENPILDVTFDGRHILNGDIVSAKPFVNISLDDENPFLLMNKVADTSRFTVYVTSPSGGEKRVYFKVGGAEQMNFIPAGSDNKCKIEWEARFTEDGIYTMRVRAWDASDNRSGSRDYKIQFEVVNRQTVTHIMNYPNPFSTRTQFVFTLTGSELPQYMKIQIFTVSGKVVREVTMDELGPLYIGKNITNYAWDGRDEFGDQLANGVYFYRVITKNAGLEDIEHRETSADQYFKKGFGKMYLMR